MEALDKIREKLGNAGSYQLQRVEVYQENGAVVLSGEVSSYYLKQVAQTICLQHSDCVVNMIEVTDYEK